MTHWADFAVAELTGSSRAERTWPTPGDMASEIRLDRAAEQTAALRLIDTVLCRIADDDDEADKAMIFAPPQSGKSSRVTRAFALWMLSRNPRLRIVIASSMSELAITNGRALRDAAGRHPELGIVRRTDSDAAYRWDTIEGGGIYCTSIGGPLTGFAVDVLILDDPVKDLADAQSAAIREKTWDWWEGVAKVRARKTVLIQTRWHTDDLAGRLLEREAGEWIVLSIPAVAERDDPLGREVGEELVTPVWKPGHYLALQKSTAPPVWNAMYQQRPSAAQGGLFKRDDWRFWHFGHDEAGDVLTLEGVAYPLRDCRRFMTVDLAASVRTSADYTVAAAWAITISGDLVLLDWVRDRVVATDHAALIAPLRQRWLQPYDVVHVEKMFETSVLSHQLGRLGVPIAPVKPEGDKWFRAVPYASLTRQHRVWLPQHVGIERQEEWIGEHADFAPKAAHDDMVDTGSMATKIVEDHWLPPETYEQERARETAPSDPDFVDLMSATF